MKKYAKFAIGATLSIILYTIAAFSDCKNLPLTIHIIPDELIGIILVVYSFLMAGITIWAIINYFNAIKETSAARSISNSRAKLFLLGFAAIMAIAATLQGKYCH